MWLSTLGGGGQLGLVTTATEMKWIGRVWSLAELLSISAELGSTEGH
jgi:hypothetical protein